MTPSKSNPVSVTKATLYCPDCGHESRINGDWLLEVRPDSVDYGCPECGTTIDSRRDPEDLPAGRSKPLFVSADD
ncbi:hypothetical protein [Halobellus marinus]|jgi:predicted RNA-binding Zn-ribbon protein involved in translation (DUF1610 family)|uniref:hypothetical protein n=1 Tax=Halobellus TaxID=1073986 RepID=UPI0028AFD23E|nr:hypothetical protein [Halobellus sp. DFY28]